MAQVPNARMWDVSHYVLRLSTSPWSVEELDGCIIVWDRNGQALTYVYFEDDPRRRSVAKLLTRDDARQIAANIARLPSLLGLDV
jgi:hypothetical protein